MASREGQFSASCEIYVLKQSSLIYRRTDNPTGQFAFLSIHAAGIYGDKLGLCHLPCHAGQQLDNPLSTDGFEYLAR